MQVIDQTFEIEQMPLVPLEFIELAGRTCYKSENKITKDSSVAFVEGLLKSGHHSVLEHAHASVRFVTDRGVTHELVRHRLASYSQESTRYCNYGSSDIQFIIPVWANIAPGKWGRENIKAPGTAEARWLYAMMSAEDEYKNLLSLDWRPEQARSVLPNSLKTEIVMTTNLREWMHVFKLRCSEKAHPQIRNLMLKCLAEFRTHIPVLFDNILEKE